MQVGVGVQDVVVLGPVSHPIDAEQYEADGVADEIGPEIDHGRRQFLRRNRRDGNVEDQQRHDDGKDAVAQRFDASCPHGSNRVGFMIAHAAVPSVG